MNLFMSCRVSSRILIENESAAEFLDQLTAAISRVRNYQ